MRGAADERPAPLARAFAYAFLAAFVACAALGIESWPLTGFKLFSQVRTGTVAGWQVTTVDHDGHEQPVDFDVLPRGYHGWLQLVGTFPRISARQRHAVMSEWAAAVARRGVEVAAVRVYRTHQRVRTDFDRPPPPVERTLQYETTVPG